MSFRRLLSIKDVCVLAGVSRRTIYRIRAAGRLPAPVRIGRRARWHLEDIERWIETREKVPFSPAIVEGAPT